MMGVVELVDLRERRIASQIGFSFDMKTKQRAAADDTRRDATRTVVLIERADILPLLVLEDINNYLYGCNIYFRDHGTVARVVAGRGEKLFLLSFL